MPGSTFFPLAGLVGTIIGFAAEAGMNGHIAKPLNITEMVSEIKKQLA